MTGTIKHHLDDALLMAYSTGNLPEALSLTVAAHISMCDECRARLGAVDTVGGALIDEGDVASLSLDSFAATMARIEGLEGLVEAKAPAAETDSLLPAPLQDYVSGDADSVEWRSVGMGVKQAVLKTSKEASVRLLYIPAGVAMPDHSHKGKEMTLVLQGAFSDEDGRFARGDIEIADQELHHHPVAEEGEDCICLTAPAFFIQGSDCPHGR